MYLRNNMTIIVDDREPKHISTSLKRRKCNVEVKQLGIGDYLLDDGVIIERKEGQDFISSMQSGRLWEQLKQMSQYKHPMVCIVMNNIWKYFYFSRGKYLHKSFFGAIKTVVMKYNIPVITFYDEDDFLRYLERIEHSTSTGSRHTTELMRRPKTMKERQENLISCAANVSIKTAQKLLNHFGSPYWIAQAQIDDIAEVSGVGKKTATNVYNVFKEMYNDAPGRK